MSRKPFPKRRTGSRTKPRTPTLRNLIKQAEALREQSARIIDQTHELERTIHDKADDLHS